jgi:hypothetical protein
MSLHHIYISEEKKIFWRIMKNECYKEGVNHDISVVTIAYMYYLAMEP